MRGGKPLRARGDLLSAWIVALASLAGLAAFFYPFFVTASPSAGEGFLAHSADAPLVTTLCLLAILAGMETQGWGSKRVALLGILAAVGAVLRLFSGYAFSPIFFLPILCGYVFGPTFGFLLGALTLLVSALLTSGVGPWLPYQMLSIGWLGMLSGWLPDMRRRRYGEIVLLAAFSLFLGLFFGAVMNLWFWPFLGTGENSEILWRPGLPWTETLFRYARFYLVTSLGWDLTRGVGNALLVLILGRPVLRLLRRFAQRFSWQPCSQEVSSHSSSD